MITIWQRYTLYIGLLFVGIYTSSAQPTFLGHDLSPQLIIDNQKLDNPWAGGFNSAQFSTLHLNEDGLIDLIVFDKTGSRVHTFVAEEKAQGYTYIYAPEYEFRFPKIFAWMLLRDFDQDGRKDIFAHTSFGVKVYKNMKTPGKPISWKQVANPIRTQGYSGLVNLQINALDIPAIVDLDDDGDMDIITFDFVQGSYLEYHKNLSVEQTGKADQLIYKRMSSCWGNIYEGQECGEFSFDLNCGTGRGGGEGIGRVLHVGSTITIVDLNGDKNKDILIGDVSCPNLYRMLNVRNNEKAKFSAFDANFPESQPVDIFIFPAAYIEDVNFDGKKDLLVSPNSFTNEGKQINFHQSAWYYENVGTEKKPSYYFQTSSFLQNTMLDLGENASPALMDYDGDGDQDLFIGNGGKVMGEEYYATLYLFENIGDARNPIFELKDEDYLTLSAKKLTDIRPFFADLNQDQKLDLAFTASSARETLCMYIPNTSKDTSTFEGNPESLRKLTLPLKRLDQPCLIDTDQDGDLDLLIGRRSGALAYYKNIGSAQEPMYTLVTENLGGIKADPTKRSLSPFIIDMNLDGKLDLITGDASGQVLLYEKFLENLEGTWKAQEDLFSNAATEQFTPYHFGAMTQPTAVDLNGDTLPDLLVGTSGGGLQIFKNLSF